MGHNDFTLRDGQRRERRLSELGIHGGRSPTQRLGLEPSGNVGRGLRFVPFPAMAGDSGVDRTVADRSEQPGVEREKRLTLGRQLHERFLDNVLGRIAPLASVKLQWSG